MREPLGLDLALVRSVHVNTSRINQRAGEYGARRKLAGEAQQAAHEDALRFMDLTTLKGGDTAARVRRLCTKARQPLSPRMLELLGLERLTVGAVCAYHHQVKVAVEALKGSGIPVAAVSTSFPDGQGPLATRIKEVRHSIEDGATEIDVVIRRELALTRNWKGLYDELVAFRRACGSDAKLKVILGVGDLEELAVIAMASIVAILAGADTIKTSTGKEAKFNATLPVGLIMLRMIRLCMDEIDENMRVGFKPAGGISEAKQAQVWLTMLEQELGEEWLSPALFRFGASSLLDSILLQMHHFATGRYGAPHQIPVG